MSRPATGPDAGQRPVPRAAARDGDAGSLAALGVLADPQRRAILLRLAGGPVCTCSDLVAVFDTSQPTVSHHLKVLREAGLIAGERCGRFTYYGVVPDALRALGEALVALADGVEHAPSC